MSVQWCEVPRVTGRRNTPWLPAVYIPPDPSFNHPVYERKSFHISIAKILVVLAPFGRQTFSVLGTCSFCLSGDWHPRWGVDPRDTTLQKTKRTYPLNFDGWLVSFMGIPIVNIYIYISCRGSYLEDHPI